MGKTEKELQIEEYVQQAKVLLGQGETEGAIAYADKALELDRMCMDAYMVKGIAFINREDLESAEKCLKNATKINKNFGELYVHLGNVSFLKDEPKEAIQYYNTALANGYVEADVYYFLGMVYTELEDADNAIRSMTKAINLDPINPVYRVRKAATQLDLGLTKEALQTLEELRKNCPDSFEGYHLAAAVYMAESKFDEADAILAQAESLFPEDRDIKSDRVKVLVAMGKIEEAVRLIEELDDKVESDLERKSLLLNKAHILAQKENTAEAVETLKDALAIKAEDSEEYDYEIEYLLMNFALFDKKYDEALSYAKMLEEGSDQNLYALGGKYYTPMIKKEAQMEDYKKDYEDAIRYYRSISLANPSRIEAYLFRAMALKDIEDYEKALETIDYVAILAPGVGQVHQIKGNVYRAMGRESDAQAEFTLAKELGADDQLISA